MAVETPPGHLQKHPQPVAVGVGHQLEIGDFEPEVVEAVRQNNQNMGAGLIERGSEELMVRSLGQIKTVEEILATLDLTRIPMLLVLNKEDLLDPKEIAALSKKMGGIAVSALYPPSLELLVEEIDDLIWPRSSSRRI